jgi:hypothetical protein
MYRCVSQQGTSKAGAIAGGIFGGMFIGGFMVTMTVCILLKRRRLLWNSRKKYKLQMADFVD